MAKKENKGTSEPKNQPTSQSLSQILERKLFGFLNVESILYLFILALTILTRFWDLGSKALHHDESLHAVYSNYLYEGVRKFLDVVMGAFQGKTSFSDIIPAYLGGGGSQGLNYHFDPMMHGPSLFHFQAFMFFISGLFIYLWKLPIPLLLVYLVVVASSIYALKKQPRITSWKKYMLWATVAAANTALLFLLVYAFTPYAQDKLAGVNDYTSRLANTILGVVLVMLPYYFRSYLGRVGALIASFMMFVSPSVMYMGRFQRHDIYLMVPALLIAFAFFKYVETKKRKFAYLFFVAIGFIYTTHEAYYIIAFAFFLFLVFALLKELLDYRKQPTHDKLVLNGFRKFTQSTLDEPKSKLLAILLLTIIGFYTYGLLTYFQSSLGPLQAIIANLGSIPLSANASISVGTVLISGLLALAITAAGHLILTLANYTTQQSPKALEHTPLLRSIAHLLGDTRTFIIGTSLMLGIIGLLYMTFLANPSGLFDAFPYPFDPRTPIGYWLSQQDVARGSQNWKYYVTLMVPYEPFAVIFSFLSIMLVGYRMGKQKIKQAFIFLGTLTTTFVVLELLDLRHIAKYQTLKAANQLSDPNLLTLRQDTVIGEFLFFIFFLGLFFIPYFIGKTKAKATKATTRFPGQLFPYFHELFLINWFILVFMVLSWAGEKMPWINIQIAVPAILVASISLRDIFSRFYQIITRSSFFVLGVLLGSFGATYLIMHPTVITTPLVWLLPVGLIVGCAAALLLRLPQFSTQKKTSLIGISILISVLASYSALSAARVSYVTPDDPEELLVYTQTSKDVVDITEKIMKVAKSLQNPNDIRITIESTQTWPFVWYLRGIPNIGYPASITSTTNEEVILIAKDNEAKSKQYLKDYVGEPYTLRWWWLVDLANWRNENQQLDLGSYLKFWFSPEAWKWIFTREVWSQKGSYDGIFYVRKDKAAEVWENGVPAGVIVEPQIESEKPTAEAYTKNLKAQFSTAWGEIGTDNGKFSEPKGIATDSKGNIYVVESKNYRVQKFSPDGKHLLTFGSAGSGDGQFKNPADPEKPPASGPNGIAIDSNDTIYIADTWNHRIQKFSTDGKFIGSFGKPGQADMAAEFWGPRGIAISGTSIFVTDTGNKKVRKFDLDGNIVANWGSAGAGEGMFNEPIGITATSQFVYVADTWNHRIQKFDHAGKFIVQWPVTGWQGEHNNNEPFLSIDAKGNILATDPPNHRILSFSPDGTFLGTFGKNGDKNLEFDKPTGLTVDKKGLLYITDTVNSRIVKVQL